MGNCCSTDTSGVPLSPANPQNRIPRENQIDFKQIEVNVANENRVTSPIVEPEVHTGPLSIEELEARQIKPAQSQVFYSGDYKLTYAYMSQRGYYPDALSKPNQDALICIPEFAKDKAYFGVFDGHGYTGELCAQFAREMIPKHIEENLNSKVCDLSTAITKAHVDTNTFMHHSPFDDSMSGTTAISIVFNKNEIHVSNVGDSRAIIAQTSTAATSSSQQAEVVLFKPLSIDQTPYRKDERERIKKTGARIMTSYQLEGYEPMHENWGTLLGDEIDESGDPPRIWHPYGDYPGTAFTRSIGDQLSEELGVYAVPEIISKTLNTHDKFIILASDGIFEFITSQNVVNIANQYTDPLLACKALVKEAYHRWLQYEVRTDDISIICIRIEPNDKNSNAKKPANITQLPRGSIYAGLDVLKNVSELKPVRGKYNSDTIDEDDEDLYATKPYRKRRDTIIGADAIRVSITNSAPLNSSKEISIDQSIRQKPVYLSYRNGGGNWDAQEQKELLSILQAHFLFQHFSSTVLEKIITQMERKTIATSDEVVIKQQEVQDQLHVVLQGECEVRELTPTTIIDYTQDMKTQKYGLQVPQVHFPHVKVFNELGFLYNKPSEYTIITTTTTTTIGTLSRSVFRKILIPQLHVISRLMECSFLRPLTLPDVYVMTQAMTVEKYTANRAIITSGGKYEYLYYIVQGEVMVTSTMASSSSNVLNNQRILKANDVFGEQGLGNYTKCMKTYTAKTDLECLVISKKTFETVVGYLSNITLKDNLKRARKSQIVAATKIATPGALVPYTNIPPHFAKFTCIHQLEIGPVIYSDIITSLRLVKYTDETNKVNYFTCRTISKQKIVDTHTKDQFIGEEELYLMADFFVYDYSSRTITQSSSTNSKSQNALIPGIYGKARNEMDIYAIYNSVTIGTLQSVVVRDIVNEDCVQYYGAQVVSSLKLLHERGILCRSLDPSMLMVDCTGLLQIIGLRFSKCIGAGRTYTICGNPEYLAPEQILGQGQSLVSDYWCLGVLLYELMYGKTPFEDAYTSELQLFQFITQFDPKSLSFPSTASKSFKSLMQVLLQPTMSERLGWDPNNASTNFVNINTIQSHVFFKDIAWEQIESTEMKSPVVDTCTGIFEKLQLHWDKTAVIETGIPFVQEEVWTDF